MQCPRFNDDCGYVSSSQHLKMGPAVPISSNAGTFDPAGAGDYSGAKQSTATRINIMMPMLLVHRLFMLMPPENSFGPFPDVGDVALCLVREGSRWPPLGVRHCRRFPEHPYLLGTYSGVDEYDNDDLLSISSDTTSLSGVTYSFWLVCRMQWGT